MFVQNYWYTTLLEHPYPVCPPLMKDITCDVLVIGAGMSGVSCAMELMGKGLDVVLVEKNILGGSSSGRSAGFLTPDSELELSQLVRRFGVKGAREIWEVPVRGIELIKGHVERHGITCDFRRQDSLFVGIGESGWKDVRAEYDSRSEVGFTDQVLYDERELEQRVGSVGFTGAVRYPNTYGIDALQYLQGLKRVLLDQGVRIFENTEIRALKGNTAHGHAGTITAAQVVVAIDKMTRTFNPLADEVFHAQTFLSISEPLSDADVARLFPAGEEFQLWDSTLVYSYWRLIAGNRLLLGGGSALTTFLPNAWYHADVINGVHARFRSHFPFLKNLHFPQFWPGRIDTTRDLLPVVVKDPTNPSVHFILGVVGLPWASFAGHFVAENILGTAKADDQRYYEYFSDRRYFKFPVRLQRIMGKPALFALSNGWAKYFQVDRNRRLDFERGEF